MMALYASNGGGGGKIDGASRGCSGLEEGALFDPEWERDESPGQISTA